MLSTAGSTGGTGRSKREQAIVPRPRGHSDRIEGRGPDAVDGRCGPRLRRLPADPATTRVGEDLLCSGRSLESRMLLSARPPCEGPVRDSKHCVTAGTPPATGLAQPRVTRLSALSEGRVVRGRPWSATEPHLQVDLVGTRSRGLHDATSVASNRLLPRRRLTPAREGPSTTAVRREDSTPRSQHLERSGRAVVNVESCADAAVSRPVRGGNRVG